MYLLLTILLGWPFSGDEKKQEVQAIHNEAKSHFKTHIDSTIYLLKQAHAKSKELNYAYGEAKSLYLLGDMADRQNKPSQATTHYLNALQRYNGMEDEKSLSEQAKICTTLGKIYREHYKITEAIEYYDRGLELALEAVDQQVFAKLLHNKAIAYRKLGEPTRANELLQQKLEMVSAEDHREIQLTYNQLGLVYHELKSYDQARAYYQKMVALESDSDPSRFRGQAYHNIANTYQAQNDYANAWSYYQKALTEKEPLKRAKDLFVTYQDMAELALEEGRPIQALSYAEIAMPLLEQLPKTPDYYDQYLLLSRCYRTFDSDQAFINTDIFAAKNTVFITLQKELIAQGKAYKMDLITTTYLNALKEHKQHIRFYWTLFSGLVFLLLAGYVTIRLIRIYRYRSPHVALNMIKNPNEMLFLMEMFRNEKEELKRTRKQEK